MQLYYGKEDCELGAAMEVYNVLPLANPRQARVFFNWPKEADFDRTQKEEVLAFGYGLSFFDHQKWWVSWLPDRLPQKIFLAVPCLRKHVQ